MVKPAIRSLSMIKINIGCGWRNFGDDWVHIDGGDYEHLDYRDITDLSQFEDNSVDLIYASHVIEYFDREEVVPLLEEWKRVFKAVRSIAFSSTKFSCVSAALFR